MSSPDPGKAELKLSKRKAIARVTDKLLQMRTGGPRDQIAQYSSHHTPAEAGNFQKANIN